jgi:CDP-diacylglycerol--glycerol-3-phosphate 3-phosphatidyltransferase
MGLYKSKFLARKVFKNIFESMAFIHPDFISYLAVVLSIVTGISFYYSKKNPFFLVLCIVLILLRMFLNTADGVVAKIRERKSLTGEIVNALPDRYSDIFTLVGITLAGFTNYWIGISAIASMFLVSYSGMLGKAIGLSWRHEGPLGKVERLVILIFFSILQIIFKDRMFWGLYPLAWSLIVFIVFGQWTIFNRVRKTYTEIMDKELSPPNKRALILFDSYTGNTKKVAKQIGKAVKGKVISVKNKPSLRNFDFIFIGTLDQKAMPTPKIIDFVGKKKFGKPYGIFITYGVPIWGAISSKMCVKKLEKAIGKKACGYFFCKGKHYRFPFYKGHPDEEELLSARVFGVKLLRKVFKNG